MAITPLSTGGSRAAAGSIILLLLSVPLVHSVVEDEGLKSALLVVVAILLGCGLGWVIGDAFLTSPVVGKILATCLVFIVAGLGLLLPAWRMAKAVDTPDAKAFLYRFFAEPLEGASLIIVVGNRPTVPSASAASSPAETGSQRTKPNYEAMTAWGTIGSAAGTGVAVLVLLVGLIQLMIAENHWQKEVTIRAIGDESLDKPFISRHCLQAMQSLDDSQLRFVSQRKPMELNETSAELVRRCFADHDDAEQEKYFRNVKDKDVLLLPKGAALLAQRVNYTLVKDGLIASLLKHRIANRALVTSELHTRFCEYDKPLVERLSKLAVPDVPNKYLFNEGDTLLWLVSSDFCAKRSAEVGRKGG